MQGIFEQALDDAAAHSDTRLLHFLLQEFLTLPVCIVQEHYQLRFDYQEQLMKKIRSLQLTRRGLLTMMIGWLAIVGLLVIVPFYAYDIGHNNFSVDRSQYAPEHWYYQEDVIPNDREQRIFNGYYDPKGYDLYQNVGLMLPGWATLLFYPMTLLVLPLAGGLLWRSWQGISHTERRLSLGVITLWAGLFVFMLTPEGQLILTWFMD